MGAGGFVRNRTSLNRRLGQRQSQLQGPFHLLAALHPDRSAVDLDDPLDLGQRKGCTTFDSRPVDATLLERVE